MMKNLVETLAKRSTSFKAAGDLIRFLSLSASSSVSSLLLQVHHLSGEEHNTTHSKETYSIEYSDIAKMRTPMAFSTKPEGMSESELEYLMPSQPLTEGIVVCAPSEMALTTLMIHSLIHIVE